MKKAKVAIVPAVDYESPALYTAIEHAIDLIGGLGDIITQGTRVFVKINHLSPASPAARGIVTNPLFVEAVLTLLLKTGAELIVGDDIASEEQDGFAVSGFRQMCQKIGVPLINLRETGFAESTFHGHVVHRIYLSRTVLDADVIVNLPKLKTHSLTLFTGGVKNMYGIIPGGMRRNFHGVYADPDAFNQMLVDIFALKKPHITIMDGIIAMEGQGPAAGRLKRLGVVLASRDTVALDAVACKIIGLDPDRVRTNCFARERGLGTCDLGEIEIVGSGIEDVAVSDFQHPLEAGGALIGRMPAFLSDFVYRQLKIKLTVIRRNCTGCAECEKACPVGAVTVRNEKAVVNHSTCIECMCCHEVCRNNAIVPRRSRGGTVLRFFYSIVQRLMEK